MALAKIIEVVSEGKTIEGAVQNALKTASESLHNIKGIEVQRFHAVVENNAIVSYRVDAKVAFIVDQQ